MVQELVWINWSNPIDLAEKLSRMESKGMDCRATQKLPIIITIHINLT